jgi:hypothetical protein
MVSRENAIVDNKITLETRFWDETTLTDVEEVHGIEIYRGDPRLPGAKLVQSIYPASTILHENNDETVYTSTGITHTQTGVWEYIVLPLEEPGLYFDKVLYTPQEGATESYEISSFDVQNVSGAGAIQDSSIGYPRAELYGSLIDAAGEPIVGAMVKAYRVSPVGLKESALVSYKMITTKTDNTGKFSIEVLTGVKLGVSIPVLGYRRIFVLNKNVSRQDIASLDSFLYEPVDNPGESNDYLGTSTGEVVRPSSTGRVSDSFFQNETNEPVFDWNQTGLKK